MNLYLIRHGETRANATHTYQPPNETLSPEGAAEVARLVRTIQELQPDHLYTSHYSRARETANYLSYATGLTETWIEDVSELKVPEELYGKSHFGPQSMVYLARWFFDWLPNNTHDGIETKEEFADRVFKAREYFADNHEGETVVVVTHSIFTNWFVAHVCEEEPIGLLDAVPLLYKIIKYENSGVTHLRYHGKSDAKVCPWELVDFNGSDHLVDDE